MIGRRRFAMVQQYGPLCTRSGLSLLRTAAIRFLGTANQPTFSALKQLGATSVVPQQSTLYLPWLGYIPRYVILYCCKRVFTLIKLREL